MSENFDRLKKMKDDIIARQRPPRLNHRANMDWQQVALNGGPPCFFVEGPRYCGRAERWEGHGNPASHDYVPLEVLAAEATLCRWQSEMLESAEKECSELRVEVARLKGEIERLTKLPDDAHVRNAEDQDEHSEQRTVLAKEVERLTKELSEAYYEDCEICEQLIVSANGDEVYTFAVCGRCWNETQKRLVTARADAIGEAIARLSQFGRAVRKVDAINVLEALIQPRAGKGEE